ncbi:hypothetical protein AVEN_143894-1, partial [Araneus ventricosus]
AIARAETAIGLARWNALLKEKRSTPPCAMQRRSRSSSRAALLDPAKE